MKKACAYIRVSEERPDQVSPDQQKQKAHLQAKLMEADLLCVYEDIDITGKHDKRPQFQAMIEHVKQNRYDVLFVYKIDRFARNARDFHRYLDILEKHGCSLLSISQNFDSSSPSGRLLRNMLADIAQFENENRSEVVKDAMITNAKRGRWNGGRTPYGYMQKGKQLILNPEEAPAVIIVFDMASSGHGVTSIIRTLEKKYKPRYGSRPFGRTHWYQSSIWRMLKNRVYTGVLPYDGKYYESDHPPLVSEETFEKAQKQLASRRKKPPGAWGSDHLLTGLLYCTHCNHGYFRAKNTGEKAARQKIRPKYSCYTKDMKGVKSCPTRLLDQITLESRVMEEIFSLAAKADVVDQSFKAWEKKYRSSALPQTEEKLKHEKELSSLQKKMAQIFSDYYDAGIISREQFMAKNEGYLQEEIIIKDAIEELAQADTALKQAQEDLETIKATLQNFRGNWEYFDAKEKQRALGSLIKQIDVYPDYAEINFFGYHKIKLNPSKSIRASMFF